ncbi:MAG: helix-turn-helix domain-containing protein [Holophagales bacterium]|nr:helix-turn-helix domain-containing protein [Holophagales bacterium]
MRIQVFPPGAALAPYVQQIWTLDAPCAASAGAAERIAPDGILEAVFHYRDPFELRYAGDRAVLQPRSSVVSQTHRYLEMRPSGASGLVSVRFLPWGGFCFFGMPVSELADRVVSADELWGDACRELEDRLAEACDATQRVDLVRAFLLERLARYRKPAIDTPVRRIWSAGGELAIGALCRELGVGQRRLQRLFKSGLGMSPKHYAVLCRFLAACRRLRRGEGRSLTQVGVDCAYYDQSHFIADFRAFLGMTPSEFVSRDDVGFLELED